MVREELKNIGNKERHTYATQYGGVGIKKNYRDHYLPTLLLKNIEYNDHIVTDHLWVNYTRGFSKLGQLTENDVIVFDGRVMTYQKGYYLDKQ